MPPLAPTGLRIAAVGNGYVDLDWDDVQLGPGDSYQAYVNGREVADGVPDSAFRVTGLTNGTSYGFRVSAGQPGAYGPWSEEVRGTPQAGIRTTVSNLDLTGLENGRAYKARLRVGDATDAGSSAWTPYLSFTPSAPVVGAKRLVSARAFALAAKASGMSMDFVARIGSAGVETNYGKGDPVAPSAEADWLPWGYSGFTFRSADVTGLLRTAGALDQAKLDDLQAGLITTGTYGGSAWCDARAVFVKMEWSDGTATYLRPNATALNEWGPPTVEGETGATEAHHVLDDDVTESSGTRIGTGGYVQTTTAGLRFFLAFETVTLPAPDEVDNTAPIVSILTGPAAGSSTENAVASFTYGANEQQVTFDVILDADASVEANWQTNGTATRYETPPLAPGQHTVGFRGTDFAGNLSDPVFRSWTVLSVEDRTAPSVPTGLVATGRNRAVDVTVPASGAADFDHYLWERSAGGGAFEQLPSTTGGFTDRDLANGVQYGYRAAAVDANGNTSEFSAVAYATPAAQPLTALTGVEPLEGNGQVRIGWNPPPAEQDVARVELRVKLASEVAGWTDAQWEAVDPYYAGPGESVGGKQYATVTGLTNDVQYAFHLAAAR